MPQQFKKKGNGFRPVSGLGLCSGGLDSILSALILQEQGIRVEWISFETPFFSARSARNAARMTNIPLIIQDITTDYMEMMKSPKAGFGKNMNPCMDCHALMFAKAGAAMQARQFDFLFSGEVVGQRPKSQNKNALRYVEKNSGFDGRILRPLSAKCLPETPAEQKGWVDRERLLDISGRGRKVQMELAERFGITDYPSPAGGCLLTDPGFSRRLKDLMDTQKQFEVRELFLLKHGRHFRLDEQTKVMVGRNRGDNAKLLKHMAPEKDVLIKHAQLAGPDIVITGTASAENIQTAAMICAAYTTKAICGSRSKICITRNRHSETIEVETVSADRFHPLMI